MSSKPENLQRIEDIGKYACVFRDDKEFMIFELKKRNKVIKMLADGIKNRLGQRALEQVLKRAKEEFEKTMPTKEKTT